MARIVAGAAAKRQLENSPRLVSALRLSIQAAVADGFLQVPRTDLRRLV